MASQRVPTKVGCWAEQTPTISYANSRPTPSGSVSGTTTNANAATFGWDDFTQTQFPYLWRPWVDLARLKTPGSDSIRADAWRSVGPTGRVKTQVAHELRAVHSHRCWVPSE